MKGNQELCTAVTKALLDKNYKICGIDTNDQTYDSIEELWRSVGVLVEGDEEWYSKTKSYWEDDMPATIDGMLGGFANISSVDITGSKAFLQKIKETKKAELNFKGTCCDCGAGIGRVTKNLLLPLGFKRCDVIEVSPRILSEAPVYIGDPMASKCRYFCTGIQEYEPAENSMDLVWIQWVIGYLTDADCVSFFSKCGKALRHSGVICLKDNVICEDSNNKHAFHMDIDDNFIVRSLHYLVFLLKEAGLSVIEIHLQEDFPESNFPVAMIALENKYENSI